ncbi:MAG TPA: 16S rRNA (cytosine(1402)-N(4))-methyltransferase RsmH [Bacteroidota bacterium]|nr:16S rRNA (cytosine(1402)-N(4))-methyltransferase RsmH [Bacteroidota bacterium]
MDQPYHTPVLLDEVLSFLRPREGGTYVDCTLGGGGHAEAVLDAISGKGLLVGFDRDPDAIRAAGERLGRFGKSVALVPHNFDAVRNRLRQLNINEVDGFLLDLGVSSHQLNDPGRGFSFQQEGPLDMRMDRESEVSGLKVVNTYAEEDLKRIFREYGEERMASRIAWRIARQREEKPMESTADLAKAVRRAVGGRFILKSLARIFQAIRIEVNDELENLRRVLGASIPLMAPGGRIVVISYNSLEDRIVKTWMREEARVKDRLTLLTKKPVVPSEKELSENKRSRSAKLRAAERKQS